MRDSGNKINGVPFILKLDGNINDFSLGDADKCWATEFSLIFVKYFLSNNSVALKGFFIGCLFLLNK